MQHKRLPPSPPKQYPVSVVVVVGVVLAAALVGFCGIGWVNMFINPTPTAPAIIIQGGDQPTDTASPADHAIFAPTVGGTLDNVQPQPTACVTLSTIATALLRHSLLASLRTAMGM